jgi:hypothetical protein
MVGPGGKHTRHRLISGGDPDTEYLSDGITESLINRLSQIPSLRVVPRSTTFRYKGKDIDPNKAGQQLKVHALLMGRVLFCSTDDRGDRRSPRCVDGNGRTRLDRREGLAPPAAVRSLRQPVRTLD